MNTQAVHKNFNPKIYNTVYLTRKKLLEGIQKHAHLLKGKMLDFGCGSKPYRSLFTVDEYIGLDFEGQGHSHANEQIDFFYDGKTFPFADNSFDCALSSEVFEHVFNLEEIVPEIHRVLKKGGIILITCPFAISEHEQPNDYARYTSFAIKHLMEKNGFEIVAYEKLGNSIDTITQLRLGYYAINFYPKLKKVPLLYEATSFVLNVWGNCKAILLSKIFPAGNELYLNNLLVCKKK